MTGAIPVLPTLCFHGIASVNFTSTFYLLVNKSSCHDHYAKYVTKFGAKLDNSYHF